ncbi:hypothetical protein [Pedobacter sp. UC225_65]|uniref:hypothetical protein n=1 Tax=Pedobacter sp. UC225_65 TaxID=3350173 RepID=UPI00366C8A53
MDILYHKLAPKTFFLKFLLLLLVLSSCQSEEPVQPIEYFSAIIDGQPWQAVPSQNLKKYNVSYKVLSHQLSIVAQGKDGARMEVSFHHAGALKIGNYPSTISDEGIQSGIFYAPKERNAGTEMSSVTYDIPVQENTVQITKLDKTDQKAYVIEGKFSSLLYALHQKNPKRTSRLTAGRFRVIYYPDAYNPTF